MKSRSTFFASLLFAFPSLAVAAQVVCNVSADQVLIRTEGLTEKTGTIVLNCQGTPGDTVSGTLLVYPSAPVTNKLSSDNRVNAMMTAETSTGTAIIGGSPLLLGPKTLSFDPFSFVMPANGLTTLTISNILVAPVNEQPVTDFLSFNGISTNIALSTNPITVAIGRRGLYANQKEAQIVCVGSSLPEDISLFSNFAGTQFATIRVTEGAPSAFLTKLPGQDSGTRILVRYSGFPKDARLFVPDVIAGSDATQPTSGGDLGQSTSGGKYTPGVQSQLLLSRVTYSTPTGAGGGPIYLPGASGSGTVEFTHMAEVPLANGSGQVAYEVVDANNVAIESAQIPTFVTLPPLEGGATVVASAKISFAPLSTVGGATTGDPVPRFRDVTPDLDCGILGDCRASYFPHLTVDSPQLTFVTPPIAPPGYFTKYLRVLNDSGGIMSWGTRITYQSGADWLRASPAAGINNSSVILSAVPNNMTPGDYTATFTVDAGTAGTVSYPVSLTVIPGTPSNPTPPPPVQTPPTPRYWQISNSANEGIGTVVPGSMATIRGVSLSGKAVTVAFNTITATVLYNTDDQINVVVPPSLGAISSADVIVTVDGQAGAKMTVPVAVAAPAVFQSGVVNEEGTLNSTSNPELVGKTLQVFATGLPLASLGSITAKIHDREIPVPSYAGPAPSGMGVYQVNFPVPGDLPAMTTALTVCGTPNGSAEKVCSPPVPVSLRR